jgi:hypothetical protein
MKMVEKIKFVNKNPNENPKHAMDYWNHPKTIGEIVPDEKSKDCCLLFMKCINNPESRTSTWKTP